MLTLIALSAVLMQDPAVPPAPPAPPEVRTRVMVMGPDGPGTLDKDGDGQVSREEFAAPINDHFARMDKDGDGRLSTGELSAGHGSMGGRGEHEVTVMRGPGGPGEHRVEIRRAHPGAEGTGGGEERTMVFVGGEPGANGEREIVIHGPGGAGGPHMIHAPGGEWTGGGERHVEIHQVGGPGGRTDMDKDGDGKISEAEFTGPLRDAFARMDVDHSGYIEDGERGGDRDVQVFSHRIETRRDGEE